MDKDILKSYSEIISSHIKIDIVHCLNNKILTPKKISQITGKRINHISVHLTQLKKSNVVICLNEDKKKGRLYQLTDLGKIVLIELKRNEI